MPFKYTNKDNISLPLAVWLMHDSYDYDQRENVISATSLLKPTRALTLIQQNRGLDKTVDIMNLVSARMGSAIHAIAEEAWTNRYNISKALETLEMSNLDDKIVINPSDMDGFDYGEHIPIYVEQRHEKEVDDFIISGYDDLSFCDTFIPELTSIATNFFELGKTAIRIIEKKVQGENDSYGHIFSIPVSIKKRTSTIGNNYNN